MTKTPQLSLERNAWMSIFFWQVALSAEKVPRNCNPTPYVQKIFHLLMRYISVVTFAVRTLPWILHFIRQVDFYIPFTCTVESKVIGITNIHKSAQMPYLQTNDVQTSASRLGFGKEPWRVWVGRVGRVVRSTVNHHKSLAGLWISVSNCSIHPTSQWAWMCWCHGYKGIQLEVETISSAILTWIM